MPSARLDALVSPFGIVSAVQPMNLPICGSRLHGFTAFVGSVRAGWRDTDPTCDIPPRVSDGRSEQRGSGFALDDADAARAAAIAEAAERYAGAWPQGRLRVAAYAEIRDLALGPDRIPALSARELEHPKSPNVPFDPNAPMRWVEAVNIVTGATVLIPAVMAYYGMHGSFPAERFWCPISTGHAAQSTLEGAIVKGILEVVERDMIATSWLQRLALPRIAPEHYSERLTYLTDALALQGIETRLYDMTADLGVPAAYCLQIKADNDETHQWLGASAGHSLADAAEHAALEAACIYGCNLATADDEPPADVASIDAVSDGCRYMAARSRMAAFSHLFHDKPGRAAPHADLARDPREALADLVERLGRRGMDALVVETTPAEFASAGLHTACVVIPQLQPMSLKPRGQYLGHSRLYRLPGLLGYTAADELGLNPWPQPFA
jgi:ribosomal protein S12 methylthiotransferase accessory factor